MVITPAGSLVGVRSESGFSELSRLRTRAYELATDIRGRLETLWPCQNVQRAREDVGPRRHGSRAPQLTAEIGGIAAKEQGRSKA